MLSAVFPPFTYKSSCLCALGEDTISQDLLSFLSQDLTPTFYSSKHAQGKKGFPTASPIPALWGLKYLYPWRKRRGPKGGQAGPQALAKVRPVRPASEPDLKSPWSQALNLNCPIHKIGTKIST